jgi:hypothetical protein
MPQFCAALLDGQDPDVQRGLGTILPQAATALGGNPRSVVRFLNNILVDAAVSMHSASPVPVQHFAVSRLLHTGWPDLLNQILSGPAAAEQASAWRTADLATKAAQPGPPGKIAAALLSDPALKDVLLSETGRDWLRHAGIRTESVRLLRQQRSISTLASPTQAVTYDAYLSYQHQDRSAVTQVMAVFAAKRLRVYSDLDLRPGEEWEKSLLAGLQNSRALCVFIGRETLASQAIDQELKTVLYQDETPVIPVILPGGPEPEALPAYLRARQCVDAREGDQISEPSITALADYLLSLR